MPRTVTAEMLLSVGACPEEREKFAALFGESVEVTRELCVQHAGYFDWDWAAQELLPAVAWVEYDKARAATAWVEFNNAEGPATAAAWAEYGKVRAAAWAEYGKVRAAAWADAYMAEGA